MFGAFASGQPGKSISKPSTWAPGTYALVNARSNTAADLSGGDYKTIIGYPLHGGENQQWEFTPFGNGYAIRCLRTPGHIKQPVYMSIEGEAREKAFVVATTQRTEWMAEQTHEGLRISWPSSDLVVELGDGVSGPQLMLQKLVLGDLRQLWHFVRRPQPEREPQPQWAPQFTKAVVPAEAPGAHSPVARKPEKDAEVVVETARAVSDPTTAETVTVSESVDYITTTRTTTTTVITTVTEVIRTPKALLPR